MIAMTMKAMPVAAMVTGGVANQDEIKAQVDKFTNIAKEVAVQKELDSIAKMIYIDYTGDYEVPKTQDAFEDYVRDNMKTKRGVDRDTSEDFWGQKYQIEWDNDRKSRGFTVSSNGPDGRPGNKDDLISGYDL